MDNETVKPTYI